MVSTSALTRLNDGGVHGILRWVLCGVDMFMAGA